MTDSNPSPDEPLTEFEQRLKAFKPRMPKVDLNPIGPAAVNLQAPQSRASTSQASTRWLGWLAASWLVGAMVGGSAVYVAMAERNPTTAPVGLTTEPRPRDSTETNARPNEVASQKIESLNIMDDRTELPLEGPLQVRSWTRMGSRLVSRNATSDSNDVSPSIGTTNFSTEPTEPPTRDRLMRELLN